jgi:hypothetical protein
MTVTHTNTLTNAHVLFLHKTVQGCTQYRQAIHNLRSRLLAAFNILNGEQTVPVFVVGQVLPAR